MVAAPKRGWEKEMKTELRKRVRRIAREIESLADELSDLSEEVLSGASSLHDRMFRARCSGDIFGPDTRDFWVS